MKTRDEIQAKALEEIKEYKRLILSWSTGVGKSLVGIKLFDYLLKSDKDARFLIVVAETAHKKNWYEEFVKHLGAAAATSLWKHVDIECYASLKKVCTNEYKAIIFDEAHHLNSEIRMDYLSAMRAEYVICMSATMAGRKFFALRSTLDITFGNFLISKIKLQDAIDNNIIPIPEIRVIPLTLKRAPNTAVYIKEWGMQNRRVSIHCQYSDRFKYLGDRKKYHDVTLSIHCSEYEKYIEMCNDIEYWKKRALTNPGNIALKNKWLQIGSQRKRFLGDLKLEKAHNLIEMIKAADKRFICYCSSVLQAEALGGKNCIHSKKAYNQNVIDSFNSGKISSLFAVNMGQEGLNLKDIEVGVIIQLDGEERGWIQKSGRIYRAEHPVIYVLYVKDTRDEEYFKNAIEGINPDYIKEVSLI